MNQSNYNQFNYGHIQPPPEDDGILARIVGPGLAAKLKNPIVATSSLLVLAIVFASLIISSYPDEQGDENVPIVQAEAVPFKVTPESPGGMDIPFEDSTIYSSLSGEDVPEAAPVENLLAEEEPVDRSEAFAAEAQEAIAAAEDSSQRAASLIEQATGIESVDASEDSETVVEEYEAAEVEPETIIQKVEAPVMEAPEKPDAMYKPGSSPDTIAFVKDVLDKKDAKSTTSTSAAAQQAASVAPAAGFSISSGTHFVQVGSVKSEVGASQEWSKIQKKYPAELSGIPYRVQRADLGDRGVFYRIQAGPMSSEDASSICGSIKAQTPGGCLVTK